MIGARIATLLAVLVAVAGCSRSTPPQRPDILAPVERTGAVSVGVNAHLLWTDRTDSERRREIDVLADAGVEWLRVDVGWSAVEEQGAGRLSEWVLGELDLVSEAAGRRGMHLWAVLWSTPPWARRGPGGDAANPDPAAYASLAGRLAERYAGRVSVWELWNEPNTASFFDSVDPAAYAALVKDAYPAIRRADPTAYVSLGGTARADPAWLESLYSLGLKGSFDAVSVHPYPYPTAAAPSLSDTAKGGNLGSLASVRDVMVAHGDGDLPLVIGELGWSTGNGGAGGDEDVGEAEQAQFVADTVRLVDTGLPYISAVFFYTDRDTDNPDPHEAGFGLLRRDLSPKPAVDALAAALHERSTRTSGPN